MPRGRMKTQRLEGDFKQHHVALALDLGLGTPHGIKRILRPSVLGEKPVLLDAIGIGKKAIGVAWIVGRGPGEPPPGVGLAQPAPPPPGAPQKRFTIEAPKAVRTILLGVPVVILPS